MIDTTQWINSRKTPLVNHYRLQHGDIDIHQNEDGIITSAEVRDNTIARYLIKYGFIDEYHLSYGLTLQDLRKSAYGNLDVKANSIYLAMLAEQGITAGYASRMYYDIIRRLTLRVAKIVDIACNCAMNEATEQDIEAKNVYRAAFEKLMKITDEVREKIMDEIHRNGLQNT